VRRPADWRRVLGRWPLVPTSPGIAGFGSMGSAIPLGEVASGILDLDRLRDGDLLQLQNEALVAWYPFFDIATPAAPVTFVT
jgi:hypothetical protein